MDSTSETAAQDELYALMCSVISKRKKCPSILCQLEEERIALSIKSLEEAKIESQVNDYKKELQATNAYVKKLLTELQSEVSSAKDAEARYQKSQRNMEKVKEFLELRGKI